MKTMNHLYLRALEIYSIYSCKDYLISIILGKIMGPFYLQFTI